MAKDSKRGSRQAVSTPIAGRPGDWTLGPGGLTIREAFAKSAPPPHDEWLNAFERVAWPDGTARLTDEERLRAIESAYAQWARRWADAVLAALAEERP